MPDTRRNRGAHPRDRECFAPEELPRLRQAASDLSWLLARGYPAKGSLKLVGDRYGLRQRQRMALQRCAAGGEDCARRRSREVEVGDLAGRSLLIDGYNVLLTVEAALGGAVVLLARDGALRDMASMSRHFRQVRQTRQAVDRIGGFLEASGYDRGVWVLDRPVSNSGRLKGLIEGMASERRWPWEVVLSDRADGELAESGEIVATADSGILDRGVAWLSLARRVVEASVPQAWLVEI